LGYCFFLERVGETGALVLGSLVVEDLVGLVGCTLAGRRQAVAAAAFLMVGRLHQQALHLAAVELLLLALLLKSGRRAGETRRLAGPVVSFEPSGVQFSKPVVITVPFNNTNKDYGNMVLAVHVYANGV
jgi:hypothetical protein